MKSKEEFCIMPPSELYSIKRFNGLVRHEVFYGVRNRDNSIKYGLIVFIRPDQHTEGLYGVHCKYGHALDMELKQIAQAKFEEAYPDLSFISIFGRNYL